MAVEQVLFVVNQGDHRLPHSVIPEQYTPREPEALVDGWKMKPPAHTTLMLWFCNNSSDLTQATDVAGQHPEVAVIIASPDNKYAEIAFRHGFACLSTEITAEDFLRAETRAYELHRALKKTG